MEKQKAEWANLDIRGTEQGAHTCSEIYNGDEASGETGPTFGRN